MANLELVYKDEKQDYHCARRQPDRLGKEFAGAPGCSGCGDDKAAALDIRLEGGNR